MLPEEYEHLVAQILRDEGWAADVTRYQRDFGVDVVAERDGTRLGVQAKMWADAGRKVAGPEVMQVYGAAAYADCQRAMIVTDSKVLAHAQEIAEKLNIGFRFVASDGSETRAVACEMSGLRFGHVWRDHVMPMAHTTVARANGTPKEILDVDWGWLHRRSSGARRGKIEIEIFRWVVEKMLAGEPVSREEINDHYAKRASSGIALILTSIGLFESVRIRNKEYLRLRESPVV
jgi:Restriction endonuclease